MKYEVTVTAHVRKDIVVQAEGELEAIQKAEQELYDYVFSGVVPLKYEACGIRLIKEGA